jgi:hypothetical protein
MHEYSITLGTVFKMSTIRADAVCPDFCTMLYFTDFYLTHSLGDTQLVINQYCYDSYIL